MAGTAAVLWGAHTPAAVTAPPQQAPPGRAAARSGSMSSGAAAGAVCCVLHGRPSTSAAAPARQWAALDAASAPLQLWSLAMTGHEASRGAAGALQPCSTIAVRPCRCCTAQRRASKSSRAVVCIESVVSKADGAGCDERYMRC